jgi:hypothetical protein
MKTNTTTTTTLTTAIELTEKEEQIIHLGLGALAGLFKTINENNPFQVKVTLDEIVKLEEKLLLKLMEENKAALVG